MDFLEEIKNVMSNLNGVKKDKIVEEDFIKLLACACVANGYKYRHFKRLVLNTIPSVIECNTIYEEDQDLLEEFFDDAKESEPCTTLHDLIAYIDKPIENKKEATPVGEITFEQKEIHRTESYLKLKNFFEKKEGWCKINHPAFYGKAIKSSDGTMVFEKEDNPKIYFENKEFQVAQVNEDGKVKKQWFNFFDVWKKDAQIKTYDRIVFDPKRSNPNDYNMFDDYCLVSKDTACKQVSLERVFEHIKSICGYDEACFEYLLNYKAHIVQKPEERVDVSVVCYGDEGVGKNLMIQLTGDVIGSQYYGESSEPKDLFGQFATGMYRRMIFVYDESSKKDTSGFLNRLKTLVTGRKLRVELKGKDCFEVDNYCRLFFPTNETQPFPITRGNRRWFYIKASKKYISLPDEERFEHFKSLAQHFQDKNVIYSFYHFLANRDLSKFNPNNFPKSEGLKNATQVPLILRCFHTSVLSKKNKVCKPYSAKELLELVLKYCRDNNYTDKAYNPTTLGNELQDYIDYKCIIKKRASSGVVYQFDAEMFDRYIKQYKFNLDDLEPTESNDNTTEKLLLQIEEHRRIIRDLQSKFLKECNVVHGDNPLDKGIDKTDQKVNPTLHYTTPKIKEKDYSKRILPAQPKEKTILDNSASAFVLYFD